VLTEVLPEVEHRLGGPAGRDTGDFWIPAISLALELVGTPATAGD
jgi:hypothetical protein